MRPLRLTWIMGLLGGAAIAVTLAVPVAAVSAAAVPAGAEVAFDKNQISVAVGDKFTLPSQITNPDAEPTGPIVAHLNVVSLTDDVYVDPEDWSAERTVFLDPLEPGATEPVTWEIQAVNAGTFAVYVVLIPEGSAPPTVSPAVDLAVAGRQTLSAGGALQVAIAVPIVLGLAAAVTRYRLRRTA